MIYNPLEEFEGKFKNLHLENTNKFFDALVSKSGVDIEENRKTVRKYKELGENLKKLKRKYNLWRFLRVLMCITLILIPLVIIKITPKIKAMREEIENAELRMQELLRLAEEQMAPLNRLFTERDALKIIEETIPDLSFESCFTVDQEENMEVNFDFDDRTDCEQSTVDALAGHYNENPFLFEIKLIHNMGVAVYHGYKTIYWTETYRGNDGKTYTRTRSETLHATVTKPKPYYRNELVLNYCAQGGPELCFTRDATHLEKKSDREIDRYVKRGEKKLKKMTDKAIGGSGDFMSMSNSDFEVLFDALDRNNELQFRTLFTPLAQTNMVDLIRSHSGFGDDFNFIKKKRTNQIITNHSRGRDLTVSPSLYTSHSFDVIKESFINKNVEYFKAVYFDFAPIWAIPMYQERPVHSLKPIPDYSQQYSYKECESLSNRASPEHFVHPATKTPAILKSDFIRSKDDVDEICIRAYSYDVIPQVDFVSVHGGDGRWHQVAVEWDDYIPLEATNNFLVGTSERAEGRSVLSGRNNVCLFS